ncbi:MAG: hypothetical protein WKG07_37130 [Hymenobacter sp.]
MNSDRFHEKYFLVDDRAKVIPAGRASLAKMPFVVVRMTKPLCHWQAVTFYYAQIHCVILTTTKGVLAKLPLW